ncbi:MAG: glycosyltransferase [Candidatus Omnitrophota bacterium]
MNNSVKRVDLIAYKMNSSDSEHFVKDVLSFSRNSIVFMFDFEKISIVHKPKNINLLGVKKIPIFRVRNYRLFCFLAPVFFIINFFILFIFFMYLCLRFRPKACWMENVFAGFIMGILRRCGLCQKAIYVPGDWLVNSKNDSFFKYLGNNVVFPVTDYFACRFSDLVLHHSQAISDARTNFWHKKVTRIEKPYIYRPRIMVNESIQNDSARKKICFIGQIRKDSGLDIIVNMLQLLRQEIDIALVVIGPNTHEYEALKKIVNVHGLEDCVKFYGFIETDHLGEILSECFCGLNLLTSKDSYSSFAMPGKLMHYIQHLLPVIVSEGIGYFSSEVKGHDLGQVIEAKPDNIKESLVGMYHDYAIYKQNILKYINNFPVSDIKDLITQS